MCVGFGCFHGGLGAGVRPNATGWLFRWLGGAAGSVAGCNGNAAADVLHAVSRVSRQTVVLQIVACLFRSVVANRVCNNPLHHARVSDFPIAESRTAKS